MGRQKGLSTLMPTVKPGLIKLLKTGTPIKQACAAVGISNGTFYLWMDKGKKAKKGQYKEFYEEVEKAKGEFVARNVAIIQKAGMDGTWQASAWLLERTHPEEFAKRDIEVNVTNNNVDVNVSETREKITRRINSIAARVRTAEDPE
jgi:hypothetical protein